MQMQYFLIYPNALIGYCYLKECKDSENTLLNLVFKSDDNIHQLMSHSFYTIVTTELKEKIKASKLTGAEFQIFDNVKYDADISSDQNGYSEPKLSKSNYWLLKFDNKSNVDFIKWKTNLIVSQNALELLLKEGAFKDIILGTKGSFNTVINRFQVEGDIEEFILKETPTHIENIKMMRKKIANGIKEELSS